MLSFANDFSVGEQVFSIIVILGINILMTAVLAVILIYLYYNMISKNTRFNMLLNKFKRFLDKQRSGGYQANYEEELDDITHDSVYSNRTGYSGEITAEKLKGARSGHNLDMERNPVSLARVQVASPRTSLNSNSSNDGL